MIFLLEFRPSQQWVHAKNSVRISNFICVCWCSLLNILQGFSVYITSSKVFMDVLRIRNVLYFILFFAKFDPSGWSETSCKKWETRLRLLGAEYWARPFCWVLIDAARATPSRNVLTQVAQPFFAMIRKM